MRILTKVRQSVGTLCFVAVLLLFGGGCRAREGVLSGELFLVADNGKNMPLGAETVRVFSEGDIDAAWAKAPTYWRDRMVIKREELKNLSKGVVESQKEALRLKSLLDTSKGKPGWVDISVKTGEASRRAKELVEEAESARNAMGAYALGAFLLDGPITPIATTLTGSDGSFRVTLPMKGRVAVGAVSRLYPAFSWIEWVDLDGQTEKHIVLSGINTLLSGNSESVISGRSRSPEFQQVFDGWIAEQKEIGRVEKERAERERAEQEEIKKAARKAAKEVANRDAGGFRAVFSCNILGTPATPIYCFLGGGWIRVETARGVEVYDEGRLSVGAQGSTLALSLPSRFSIRAACSGSTPGATLSLKIVDGDGRVRHQDQTGSGGVVAVRN